MRTISKRHTFCYCLVMCNYLKTYFNVVYIIQQTEIKTHTLYINILIIYIKWIQYYFYKHTHMYV